MSENDTGKVERSRAAFAPVVALAAGLLLAAVAGGGYQIGHEDGYSRGASETFTRMQAQQAAPRIEFSPSGDTGMAQPFDTRVSCLRHGRGVPCTQEFVREMMAAEGGIR